MTVLNLLKIIKEMNSRHWHTTHTRIWGNEGVQKHTHKFMKYVEMRGFIKSDIVEGGFKVYELTREGEKYFAKNSL